MRNNILAGIMAAVMMIMILSLFTGCSSTSSSSSSTTTKIWLPSGKITVNSPIIYPTQIVTTNLPEPGVQRISVNDLAAMMNNNEDFILVDLRYTAYNFGHIVGAVYIPNYPGGDNFFKQLGTLPTNKLIVFYCSWVDDLQAAQAAVAMASLKDASGNVIGYDLNNMRALGGGYLTWIANKYPTTADATTLTETRPGS